MSAVHKQDGKEEKTKNSSVRNKTILQSWILSPLLDDGLFQFSRVGRMAGDTDSRVSAPLSGTDVSSQRLDKMLDLL